MNAAPLAKVMSKAQYWYYFNTVYFYDGHSTVDELDVMQEVLDADFVMIAYNTAQIYKMSQGFSQKVLIDMCCDPEDILEARRVLEQKILNNAQWMSSLTRRAEKYEIPIDSAVVKEARNNILNCPTRFVPVLKDTIPATRSRKFMASADHVAPQSD